MRIQASSIVLGVLLLAAAAVLASKEGDLANLQTGVRNAREVEVNYRDAAAAKKEIKDKIWIQHAVQFSRQACDLGDRVWKDLMDRGVSCPSLDGIGMHCHLKYNMESVGSGSVLGYESLADDAANTARGLEAIARCLVDGKLPPKPEEEKPAPPPSSPPPSSPPSSSSPPPSSPPPSEPPPSAPPPNSTSYSPPPAQSAWEQQVAANRVDAEQRAQALQDDVARRRAERQSAEQADEAYRQQVEADRMAAERDREDQQQQLDSQHYSDVSGRSQLEDYQRSLDAQRLAQQAYAADQARAAELAWMDQAERARTEERQRQQREIPKADVCKVKRSKCWKVGTYSGIEVRAGRLQRDDGLWCVVWMLKNKKAKPVRFTASHVVQLETGEALMNDQFPAFREALGSKEKVVSDCVSGPYMGAFETKPAKLKLEGVTVEAY